ncbi:MAG: C40 family peptidase [Candidatus Marinimicrobia bacterium]|nr:C40 family peptidase [Candidatus Neomarinimicrobiota bacterium]MCF7850510.1 C40 family peptidase [Candidatus Neomarinimicrobiota bacterium]MCF7903977.1 C40 family peptidase [Candidatus Neomarinimicrobiota bacterium]
MKLLTNISIANVYRDSTFGSETISQSYMGEQLEVLEQKDSWFLVLLEDGYKGWIPSSFVVEKPEHWDDHEFYATQSHVSKIYESPDQLAPTFRDVTILSKLPATSREAGWIQVLLPDGLSGWIPDNPRYEPSSLDVENLLEIAHSFLGIQYFWGAKSPKGFDCSGFVQTCFKLQGLQLPRDAYLQAEVGEQVSSDFQDWQAGDLIYFSERTEKISHVAIALEDGKFIHASGFVRINSMNPEHGELYTAKYSKIYTKTMRVL